MAMWLFLFAQKVREAWRGGLISFHRMTYSGAQTVFVATDPFGKGV